LRNSKQCDLILDIINNSYIHPTALEIYTIARTKIDNISLGTVYRNINKLKEMGKIRCIKTFDNIDRFDRKIDNHSHLICIKCNKIIDIKKDFLKGCTDIDNNKILDCEVVFTGICQACLKKEGEK